MRAAIWLSQFAMIAGCASEAPPERSAPTTGTMTNAAGMSAHAGAIDSGLGGLANPDGILPAPSGAAAAGSGAGGMGGTGAGGIPQGCEVGKFCAASTPDPDNCGSLTLKQDVEVTKVPGNLLVIFDQSLSMDDPWGMTGMTKLQAAQRAIANAVMSLQGSLTVGALFFPTYDCVPALPPPPGGAVSPIDAAGQIPFQPGPQFLQAWNQHWNAPLLGIRLGTPMQEAFDRADVAIRNAKLTGASVVLAITDGAPTCFPDPNLTMTPTALETERATAWLSSKSVKTYVVGLPGAAGVQLLNDVARNGGTMQYLLPDDPKVLEAKLKELVMETVKTKFDSCMIKLTPPADPPEKLQMLVVEAKDGMKSRVEHMLGPNAGWTISADGMQVEITGLLCDDAKKGRFSSITFEYGCKNMPPPPPLPPPVLN